MVILKSILEIILQHLVVKSRIRQYRRTNPEYHATTSKEVLLFKDKMWPFYIRTRCVPRCKYSPHRLYKTRLLMLYRAKIPLCSEICTHTRTHTQKACEHYREF